MNVRAKFEFKNGNYIIIYDEGFSFWDGKARRWLIDNTGDDGESFRFAKELKELKSDFPSHVKIRAAYPKEKKKGKKPAALIERLGKDGGK